MLDMNKVDLLESYRKRVHDWCRAYAYTYDSLSKEIHRRRWLTKLWNRGSFCIISLSIFVGSVIPSLISNLVLFRYIQIVLLVGAAILWTRFFWSLIDGPEQADLLAADMVELVDTGDLKSPAITRRAGSSPVIGTNS